MSEDDKKYGLGEDPAPGSSDDKYSPETRKRLKELADRVKTAARRPPGEIA